MLVHQRSTFDAMGCQCNHSIALVILQTATKGCKVLANVEYFQSQTDIAENGNFSTQPVFGRLLADHTTAYLIALYGFEKCGEIAFTKTFVFFALNKLEENRPHHRF